tara:strand:+ start:1960 stop:3660 length:1701 start_codon:yes stop_codon:yes gene_type:complete
MFKIHKLYSPEEYGGGGTSEEASGGGASPSAGSEGPGGAYGGGEGPSGEGPEKDDELVGSNILSAGYSGESNLTKKITSFTVSNYRFLSARGETRRVTIKGIPGSMFSLTILDSSGCDILLETIENVEIPSNGRYEFSQEFPSITTSEGMSITKETYTLSLAPAADVDVANISHNNIRPVEITLYQYADPTITITNTTSQTGPALVVTGDNGTITGTAGSSGNKYLTYTLSVTNSSAVKLYINPEDIKFNKNITTSTLIKKVIDRDGATGITSQFVLDPLTTRTETTIEGDDFITDDLQVGMAWSAKSEHSKSVVASLDKDNNILDYGKCSTYTNKFKLENTNDLVPGMIVGGEGVLDANVVSVDCDKTITLSSKQFIRRDTVLKFINRWRGVVKQIDTNNNSKGQAVVFVSGAGDIPHGTTIEFDDNSNLINGSMTYSGSGTDSITLTSSVRVGAFGKNNTTFTLDLDNIITKTPNAYDQNVTCKKNSSGIVVDMIKNDRDSNATSKTGTVVRSPQYGTVSSYTASTDTFRYIPNKEFTGEDSFTFTMSDGTNTSNEKRIKIIVK